MAREILDGVSKGLAKHHGVSYAADALASSITWSVRYLPDRVLPDKALSILDLAGARARRRGAREVSSQGIAEVVAELADIPVERLLETDGVHARAGIAPGERVVDIVPAHAHSEYLAAMRPEACPVPSTFLLLADGCRQDRVCQGDRPRSLPLEAA